MSDRRLNLVLHCGGKQVTRDEVSNATCPAATSTWHPIPHEKLIELALQRLRDTGLELIQECHGMYGAKPSDKNPEAKPTDRYFGMFEVQTDSDDFSLVVGLRNSHDKTFPAGLCLGDGVFVCDNLAFSAEIVFGRRHTVHIMRDLPDLVSNAVGMLMQAKVSQETRINAYKEVELSREDAVTAMYDAARLGGVQKTRFYDVVDEYLGRRFVAEGSDKPSQRFEEFAPRTAWSVRNAFTQVWKESAKNTNAILDCPRRTVAVESVLDKLAGLMTREQMAVDLRTAFEGVEVR